MPAAVQPLCSRPVAGLNIDRTAAAVSDLLALDPSGASFSPVFTSFGPMPRRV